MNEIKEANKVEQNKSPDNVPMNTVNEETVEQHGKETDQDQPTSVNTNYSNRNDDECVIKPTYYSRTCRCSEH